MKTVDYNELTKIWQSEIKYGPTHRIKRKILKKLLSKLTNRTICDIGCGNGYYTHLLKDKNRVYSIDISENAISFITNEDNKINLILGDLNKLPFKNESFEVVLLFDILEHMKDDDQCIAEITKVLKKNGLLFLTVPNDPCLFSNIDKRDGHYRRYSKDNLIQKFSNNYDIKSLFSFGFPLTRLYMRFILARYYNKPDNPKPVRENILTRTLSNLAYWLFCIDLLFLKTSFGVLLYAILEKR